MGYYDLPAPERKRLYARMERGITRDISAGRSDTIEKYASNEDTYIRKNCYLILGRLYYADVTARKQVLTTLDELSRSADPLIRQTAVFALGEIGKQDFNTVEQRLSSFLRETHPAVKKGLTGAIKQMGEKNPRPVFAWARAGLSGFDADLKTRILHGLELRGRTHPEDLLPVLKRVLTEDADRKTGRMVVHIVGQISYKKGCLEKVLDELDTWEDKELVAECAGEIIDVHKRYARFSAVTPREAARYVRERLGRHA